MSSRYVPREQALPNSSRRLARASQRSSSNNNNIGKHGIDYETTSISTSHRRIHSDNEYNTNKSRSNRNIAQDQDISHNTTTTNRDDRQQMREYERSKRKEAQQKIKEIQHLIQDVKQADRKGNINSSSRERRSKSRIGEQGECTSSSHRDYERRQNRSRKDDDKEQNDEEYINIDRIPHREEYPLPQKERSSKRIDEEPSFDSAEIDGASELTSHVDYGDANPTGEDGDDQDFAEQEFDSDSEHERDDEFEEDIDETTYCDEDGNIITSHNNYRFNNDDSEDDVSEESQSNYIRRGHRYDDVNSDECDGEDEPSIMSGMVSRASEYTRSNSPEPNPNSRGMNLHHHETAAAATTSSTALVTRQISSDPPTSSAGGKLTLDDYHMSMEPNEEIGSVYQRNLELDAPPSPKGPELRRRDADIDQQFHHSKNSRTYDNYKLDDVGREEYNNEMKMIAPINEGVRKMKVQQDPPESNRGLDVPALRAPRVRSSRSSRREQRHKEETKKKQQPPLKGILKKKISPPIDSYFGKPIIMEDEVSCGSDPSVTESKLGRGVAIAHSDDDDVKSSSGGMRSGKYATINESSSRRNSRDSDKPASRKSSRDSDDKSAERNNSRDDYDGGSKSDESFDIKEQSDEESDAAGTIQTIYDSKDDRFDRSKTYYLRTSDLGLTQDTIFPEQFLDNPKSKAEPHYHHPSPHPPPGIQFSIDENYLAINDGKGSHSPVAPQAVDALVAVGYRTACDPVMWTPTSKTRKYMTERGLRFSDAPLPGPLEEGEGGAEDSSCMVFTGKFTHKYYGNDIIAIRSQGIVNMSAENLVDLLMDSNRIQEYNSSSTGRSDEIILSDGTDLDSCPFSGRRKKKLTGVVLDNTRIVDGVAFTDSSQSDEYSGETEDFDDDGNKSISSMTSSGRNKKKSSFVGVTKVVRSINKVPFVKKKMEFVTLVHCRALTDDQGGNGYIIVSRNVFPAEDAEKSGKGMMRSEVLLNVHLIRKFKPQKKGISSRKNKSDGRSVITSASGKSASARELVDRCLMINVSHLKSPIIPSVIAKKMGSAAAASFINDIRALTVNWN